MNNTVNFLKPKHLVGIIFYLFILVAIPITVKLTQQPKEATPSRAEIDTTLQATANLAPPSNLGEQRIAILLVNFRNYTQVPYDKSQAASVISLLDSYFREVSYGKVWFTGDALGWYTLDMDNPCLVGQRAGGPELTAAIAAAENEGVDFSKYNRIALVPAGCHGVPMITMWSEDTPVSKTYDALHEIGHSFGLGHAQSIKCGMGTAAFSSTSTGNHGKILFYGGVGGGIHSPDYSRRLLWIYDPQANSWMYKTHTTTNSPIPYYSASMVFDSNLDKAVLFGGGQAYYGYTYSNKTWIYDLTANTWTEKTPANSPPARTMHAMVYDSFNKKTVLFGGSNSTGSLNDTWLYESSSNTWTQVFPDNPPDARNSHSMVFDPGSKKIVLFGGRTINTIFNDTWLYDTALNTWTKQNPTIVPPTRNSFGMAYLPSLDKVIIFGGQLDIYNKSLSDLWGYNVASNTWVNLNSTFSSGQRFGGVLNYDPVTQKLILYGGKDTSSQMGKGMMNELLTEDKVPFIYNPQDNSWNKGKPTSDYGELVDPKGLTVCSIKGYGEPWNVMGQTISKGHFNAAYKKNLHWISENNITIAENGTYDIQPLETAPLSLVQLIVPIPGKTEYYSVESRKFIGFDNFSAGTEGNISSGALIYLVDDHGSPNYTGTILLDNGLNSDSHFDAALETGKTFYDQVNNIKISTVSVSDAGVKVKVETGRPYNELNKLNINITPEFLKTNIFIDNYYAVPPFLYWCEPGTTFKLYASSTVSHSSNVYYDFLSWSDGGAREHTVSCNGNSTYTVNYSLRQSSVTPSPTSIYTPAPTQIIYPTNTPTRIPTIIPINTPTPTRTPTPTWTPTPTPTIIPSPPPPTPTPTKPGDTTGPYLTFTSPPNGYTISKNGTLKINTTQSDPSGIYKTEIVLNNLILKSCLSTSTCSVNYQVNRIPAGYYTIKATSWDNSPLHNDSSQWVNINRR